MAQEQLTNIILLNSDSKKWDLAKLEWDLVGIEESSDERECTCGHSPIREICTIKNRISKISLEVGNHCVKKFIGINSEKLFAAYRKVTKNESASFNLEIIILAQNSLLITDWEANYYCDIWRKMLPSLSEKQLLKKIQVNKKILNAIRAKKLIVNK